MCSDILLSVSHSPWRTSPFPSPGWGVASFCKRYNGCNGNYQCGQVTATVHSKNFTLLLNFSFYPIWSFWEHSRAGPRILNNWLVTHRRKEQCIWYSCTLLMWVMLGNDEWSFHSILFFVIWFRALDVCVWVNRVIFPKIVCSRKFGIVTCYGLDSLGIESRWGARFVTPIQTSPGAHPACCAMRTGSISWGKSGQSVALTTHPHLAQVKERVEVYFYSPSGPSWPVLGWKLPFLHVQQEVWFKLMSTNLSSLTEGSVLKDLNLFELLIWG
jgi:hypothetical protein